MKIRPEKPSCSTRTNGQSRRR